MSQESRLSVIRLADVEPITTSTYPPQFQERVRGRIKWRLGTSAGLANLSVVLVELPPGVATSLRMWQTAEDEFAYVLEGRPTLITDTGEVEMSPGESVGFPAGRAVGHHFVNRGRAPAHLLEMANIAPSGNESIYTEDDLLLVPSPQRGGRVFVNRKRVPY